MKTKDKTMTLHWCDWSQQPDIHLACGVWTQPAWVPQPEGGPYIADIDGGEHRYAFRFSDAVTCEKCREAHTKAGEAPR